MNTLWLTRIAGVVTATASIVLGSAAIAGASPDMAQNGIAAVRAATAAYHDISNVPDSYQDSGLPCMQTAAGGMGIHLLDVSALSNPSESATHPEALVYAETRSGPELVAVEYIVPASAVPDPQHPPVVLGHKLTEEIVPGAGDLYVLHAWIWRHNPAGMFQDWNPALDSCRTS